MGCGSEARRARACVYMWVFYRTVPGAFVGQHAQKHRRTHPEPSGNVAADVVEGHGCTNVLESVVDGHRCDLHARVDGGADGPPQWVP